MKLKDGSNWETTENEKTPANGENQFGKVFQSKLTVNGNSFDKLELITCNRTQTANLGKCKTCLHNLTQFRQAAEHNFQVLESLKSEIAF